MCFYSCSVFIYSTVAGRKSEINIIVMKGREEGKYQTNPKLNPPPLHSHLLFVLHTFVLICYYVLYLSVRLLLVSSVK